MSYKRYTVTSALPYANGPLHIGHIAGAYLPADIYVRFLRMQGKDVVFISGSDEHGAAITIQAKKEGITPQQIVDKYHELNKESFKGLGIDFDIYHRTSSKLHHQTASDYFLHLYEQGVFEEEESDQFYDEEYHQFLADRYVTGTCPKCSNPRAYGDQCENCGTSLSPTELIDPKSTLSGKTPVLKTTKHWYLPLNKYEAWLREWIVDGKGRSEDWKKNVFGQCKSWLDDGLKPRSITRDLDWGVKVPLKDAEGKVLYVWLDAPIGYISATKQWAEDTGNDWKPYWQDQDTKLVHFIGKDNIVFHCIIFPVILKSHGDYILPTNVPANEFMNLEGDKLSTSRNWAIWVKDYLAEFPDMVDVLRYVLCANFPETKDSEFTWKDFQARNNNELVATLGNFVNRVMVLTQKYFDGVLPAWNDEIASKDIHKNLKAKWSSHASQVADHIEHYRFRQALSSVMELAHAGNKYLGDTEPWKLIKEDKAEVAVIMRNSIELIVRLVPMLHPFLPTTASSILEMLNLPKESLNWELATRSDMVLPEGHDLNQPQLLFKKLEDAWVEEQVAKLVKKEQPIQAQSTPIKPEIQYEDFARLDIRTGKILEAEKVPKADKLLKLTVDIGSEKRTIVSGIAQYFKPEDLPGQQVLVLVNLQPRKLRGVESQGMILMAEDDKGALCFVKPDRDADPGLLVS